jgi:glycosyltransferase involved in cell wall biosynthesis
MYIGDQRPELLFDALDRLCARRPDVTTKLDVQLVGTRRETELQQMLLGRAAATVCHVLPRVGPDAAIALQHSADALLILNLTNAATVNGTLSYPSKIFEYLQARRPILVIPPDPGGWVTRIIDATRSGVSLASIDEIATQLELWIDEWSARGKVPFRGDANAIDRFSCDAQAAKLAALLDDASRVRATTGAGADATQPVPAR